MPELAETLCDDGVTEIEVTPLIDTVTLVDPLTVAEVAWIEAVPEETPVTNPPFVVTVATVASVVLQETDARQNVGHDGSTTYRDFELWKVQNRTFGDMTIFYKPGWGVQTPTAGAEPEKARGAFIASNFFSMMGVAPVLGRIISPE